MARSSTFLRSKVGRRIVLLFVSCVLLPVSILAVVTFYEVSSQLREEGRKQLVRASKDQGMTIYERLELLDSDLQLMSAQIRESRSFTTATIAQGHFKGYAEFGPGGSQRGQWGSQVTLPHLTSAEHQHLLAGNPLLHSEISTDGTGYVSMMRIVDSREPESPVLVGTLDPEYLWATKSLPPDFQFCVLSSSRSVLFCSDDGVRAGASAFPAYSTASGIYQWKNKGVQYDTSYWKLLVKPTFFEDSWTIAVCREHDLVLAPMLRFRKIFPLIILLSLWIVLLASLTQIRRTLGPLEKLQEGTRKLGARQFDSRVDVSSGDEFESLATAFNSMVSQLGTQFRTQETIREIDQAIFSSLDREAIVDGVLTRMPSLFPGQAFGVCTFDDALLRSSVRFFQVETAQLQTNAIKVTSIDWLQLQNNPVCVTLAAEDRIPAYLESLTENGMRSFGVFPIRVDNLLQAALICAYRSPGAPAFEHLQEVCQIVDQLAIAFSHVRLVQQLEQMHWATITALARAIDAKSNWTAGHSERVTDLAVEIGRNMGLSSSELRIMKIGGLLHDIGKIGTPPTILDKPGKLTSEETRVMQDHVITGMRILEPIPGFREALPIVAQHHEWFNGKGYPEGLSGKEISLHARIFAVADCYDAVTSDRPYRKGLPKEQVLAILQEKSGSQFDPDVIDLFVRMMTVDRAQKAEVACAIQNA
jgi:putative nucleotidyltransferase with HDIG domain